MTIIDTHVHIYDPSRPEGVPWPPKDTPIYRTVLPADCRAVAEPEGVSGVVVVEASDRVADNDWILGLADDEPFLKALVGRLEPGVASFAADVERLAGNPRFRGIRFRGPDFVDLETGGFLHDMETLARHGLHLDMMFGQETAAMLAALAARLPQLPIVIEHIGGVAIDGGDPPTAWVESMQQMAAFPQVAMKVSAVIERSAVQPPPQELDFYRPVLDTLWDAFGEDRVVYGSNWPVCERAGTYADAISVVRRYFMEKGEAAAAKYFSGNARRIYRWPEA
jgi:L-fuconolactonase